MTARLLIVDDDPQITSALARGLALHGYEAETENRADRALDRLLAGTFRGAIVDVMLGADSGLDLVRTAREEQDFASEQFLQWFIKEQVEEIATMSDLLAVVRRNLDDVEDIEEYVAREQDSGLDDPTAPRVAGASARRGWRPGRTITSSNPSPLTSWWPGCGCRSAAPTGRPRKPPA